MRFTVTMDAAVDDGAAGPVTVGWMLTQSAGSVIFDAPSRLHIGARTEPSAKSAGRCPAVLNFESRFFEVSCPYDLSLGFQRDEDGTPEIVNLLGDQSPVRLGMLSRIIEMTPENEWRHPERPIFQLKLPYLFLADEPVWLGQIASFAHFRPDPLPGLTIGGRFPVHVWPRPLMWAFEWHDTEAPVTLSRGEPLFYVQFETLPQDRPVRLVEAARTPELDSYLEQVSGVVNFVNQTFSLFEEAEKRRPTRLLTPVERPR